MTRTPSRNLGLTRLRIIANEQHGIAVNGTEYSEEELSARIMQLSQSKADDSLGPDLKKPVLERKRRRKRQGTRLLKAQCPDDGYLIRVTSKWARLGLPICPLCNVPLEISE